LTKIEKNFSFRNVLVPFLNLLLLQSCKKTICYKAVREHPFQSTLRKRNHHSVSKIKFYSWIYDKIRSSWVKPVPIRTCLNGRLTENIFPPTIILTLTLKHKSVFR